MNIPLISIIVPCFNQAQYLGECLSSILSQTFREWECIIVNDGSPDHTEEVAKKWCENDIRFKYVSQQNEGVSAARNTGIVKASGVYILPLDADDKIDEDYVLIALKAFEDNPNLKVVYGRAIRFGISIEAWDLPNFSLRELALNNIIYCSAIYRKTDWIAIGGYDVNLITGFEDWEFWISLLKNGGEVFCLPETVFYYRIKENSRHGNLTKGDKKELFKYLSVKHSDFFVNELGSFQELNDKIVKLEYSNKKHRYFKKQILNNFCNAFFGFNILKND